MQKAKRRIKSVPVPAPARNGNGFHENAERIPAPAPKDHFIASIAGSYKDDPFWDEFVGHMEAFRRVELERDLKNLENEP